MKKVLLFAVALLFACPVLRSQITITASDIPGVNTVITQDQIDAFYVDSLVIGTAGPNQVWDFSAAPAINVLHSNYYLDPAQTPHPDAFSTDNLSSTDEVTDTSDYTYYLLNNTSFSAMGSVSPANVVTFTPPLKLAEFPATYQSSFNQSVSVTGSSSGLSASGTAVTNVVADAYGTVKTALGTFPCLRVKRITEVNLTVLIFNVIQRDTSYEWWTNQYKAPVFTYNRNYSSILGTVEYGAYARVLAGQSVPTGEPVGVKRDISLQLMPNPATSASQVSFEISDAGRTGITVVDATGKTVLQQKLGNLNPGVYQESIDLSGVQAGMYVVVLQQEGRIFGMQKLIKN